MNQTIKELYKQYLVDGFSGYIIEFAEDKVIITKT